MSKKQRSAANRSKSPKGAKEARRELGIEKAAPVTDPAAGGQRCYDMPFSATGPRLLNPDLGLHNLVARAGHNAGYEMDVTLLDGADHRLIRSGVVLAHRVLDGRGEWYLGASDWAPLLPEEQVELMGHADIPEEFADLVRPFRRRMTLGPTAALHCERREFALRDDGGTTLALVRDDKVTVRRGGLTTARYREVLMTPVGPALTEDQEQWIDRALLLAGATPVSRFPPLVTRLGAPATGRTDFPRPQPLEASAPFATFVARLLSRRLREMVSSDLMLRQGNPQGATELAGAIGSLRAELSGLAFALDSDWVADLDEELHWVVDDPDTSEPEGIITAVQAAAVRAQAHERLLARMRSERYLMLLELLVTAARGSRLGDLGMSPAGDVLQGLLRQRVLRLGRAVAKLTVDGPAEHWDEARDVARQVQSMAEVAAHAMPEHAAEVAKRMTKPTRLLDQVQQDNERAQRTVAAVTQSTPAEAFQAGRNFERDLDTGRATRKAFLKSWDKAQKRLNS